MGRKRNIVSSEPNLYHSGEGYGRLWFQRFGINEKEDILNSEIWVFDWNGNPITKICTNKKIICFCVDPSESMIYCIFKDADYEIGKLKYVLWWIKLKYFYW